MMPKIAEGGANKLWIVPSEIGKALEGLGSTMNDLRGIPQQVEGPLTRVDMGSLEPATRSGNGAEVDSELSKANAAVEAAIAEAADAANPGRSAPRGSLDTAADATRTTGPDGAEEPPAQ